MHSMTAATVEDLASTGGALDALARRLSGAWVAELSHDQLSRLLAGCRRHQGALAAVTLEVVGEIDARGSFALDGALTAGAWLRQQIRVTPTEAATVLRTARVLRSEALPATRAALAAGQVGPEHVSEIARQVVDAPAGAVALIEPEVLAVAREADVRAVAGVMRAFGHALDPDTADAAAVRRYQRAGITLSPTLDGSMAISGLADEVTGSLLATAIDLAAPPAPADTRSPARRRLDGLAELATRFLADPSAPRRGGGGHPHLIVTVDQHTLAGTTGTTPTPRHSTDRSDRPDGSPGGPAGGSPGGPAGGSPGGTLSWIGRITGSTARRVGCDSLATFVTIGPDGQVLEAGTQRRFFTAAQRRAIIARDGDRCGWPWCDNPIGWADAHHLRSVEAGGPTTVTNGALPCQAHHVHLHEGGWQLHRLPDGRYQARHPATGRTLGPEPHPPGHNRPGHNRPRYHKLDGIDRSPPA